MQEVYGHYPNASKKGTKAWPSLIFRSYLCKYIRQLEIPRQRQVTQDPIIPEDDKLEVSLAKISQNGKTIFLVAVPHNEGGSRSIFHWDLMYKCLIEVYRDISGNKISSLAPTQDGKFLFVGLGNSLLLQIALRNEQTINLNAKGNEKAKIHKHFGKVHNASVDL
jgi:hypothetical protein